MLKSWLQRRWYSQDPPPRCLLPLSALYGWIAERRRHKLQSQQAVLSLPVIVVGNISIGGTGKTPFVIYLVETLHAWGLRPGVIARGYGGQAPSYPLRVQPDTDAVLCGDEPLLIACRTRVPVVVDPDRVAAARVLIESGEVDVLIADDGLQHYRLPRQIEFCVIDGRRGWGNGALLPAGPLRETRERLNSVDRVVINGDGGVDWPSAVRFQLRADPPRCLIDDVPRELESFRGGCIHAVAGIGDPERFFSSLEAAGLRIQRHAFADHHRYRQQDFAFDDGAPVLMTEKDAVKCRRFARAHWWYCPVSALLSPGDTERVRESIQSLLP